jgi:plastocyanin
MRIPRLAGALAVVAASALLLAACSNSGATQAPATQAASQPAASQPAASSGGGGSAVTIQNFAFEPKAATVAAGGSLTWTNKDDAPHTVTFDDASITSSGNLSKDQTFSATFATAGTFTYKCSIHPNMTGEVTVS